MDLTREVIDAARAKIHGDAAMAKAYAQANHRAIVIGGCIGVLVTLATLWLLHGFHGI